MSGIKKQTVRKVLGPATSALNPLDVLKEYVRMRQTVEQEETKRQKIEADRDVAVTSVLAQRDMLLGGCEAVFGERREALTKLYDLLDQAQANGDDRQRDAAISGIVGIVTSSPFKGFQELREATDSGSTEKFEL